MATIYVGSARIDENGKATGGAVGDQKQKSTPDYSGEVSMQKMYTASKGWYILRPKSEAHATALAKAMTKYCNDANIGYDQSNRLGIMSYNGSGKTECDCSSLVRRCIKDATGKDVGNFTTANEASTLAKSGLFESRQAYTSQAKTPVYDGDVLVTQSQGHTVIVVSGNPRSGSPAPSGYYPKYTGSSTSIVDALSAVGEKDTSKAHRTKIAAANGISNYSGTASQNLGMVTLLKKGKLIKA